MFRKLGVTITLTVPHQVVGGCDHQLLLFGESAVVRTAAAAAAAATATTAALLGLAEVQTEGTDLQEVDVTLCRAAIRPPVAVLHLGVVGNEVTGLEAEILEKERVRAGNFLRCGAVEQRNGILGATVNRVDEKQLGDAVVVVGCRFEVEFLDRTRALIAPGLGKRHRRWLIPQNVDRVLRRGLNEFSTHPL